MLESRSCKTCRFFQVLDDGSSGRCHRNAPHPYTCHASASSDGAVADFPFVGLNDWCGEWESGKAGEPAYLDDPPWAFLRLSKRASSALKKGEIGTMRQLLETTQKVLLALHNFGDITLTEVIDKIHDKRENLRDDRLEIPWSRDEVDSHATTFQETDGIGEESDTGEEIIFG